MQFVVLSWKTQGGETIGRKPEVKSWSKLKRNSAGRDIECFPEGIVAGTILPSVSVATSSVSPSMQTAWRQQKINAK